MGNGTLAVNVSRGEGVRGGMVGDKALRELFQAVHHNETAVSMGVGL
jgi:hypothetical protein